MLALRSLASDTTFRALAAQLALAAALGGCFAWIAMNTRDNLASRGIAVGFDFLTHAARFPISEHLLSYTPSDDYAWAYLNGLVNTLAIALPSMVLATLLGAGIGLARRSQHPLLSGLATIFVEVHRNTPLIVQLLFWYALITTALPSARQALEPLPGMFLSMRGVYFPRLDPGGAGVWLWPALLALIAAMAFGPLLVRRTTSLVPSRLIFGLVGAGLIIGAATLAGGMRIDWPQLQGFNFRGGATLTPEFTALLIGLVLYSASFIGEVVRGGIDAVGRGQWEAGRSIGLTERQTLLLIIFPQALRIMVPPMGSQYLSLIKNTTLALAVGYPDFASVAATTINQTGQAIEGVLILMATYLTISLTVSLAVNAFNRRIMLVSR
jgi:general L-amino acid transport system permease protein